MDDRTYQESLVKNDISKLNMIIGEMYKMQAQLDFAEDHYKDEVSEGIDYIKSKFNRKIQDIYIVMIAYLNGENNEAFMEMFVLNFKHIFKSDHDCLIYRNDDYGEDHFFSPELEKMKRFLKAFRGFDIVKNENLGLLFLENILSSTSVILSDLKIIPKSETEVYNGVKHVINSTFPDYIGLTESFYKQAKHYKPDVLIPSINTAVEYKFARNKERLIKTIEEILIDVNGYSDHSLYKIFYAVFYVSSGVVNNERFKVIWDSYDFPLNWKPILVIGT